MADNHFETLAAEFMDMLKRNAVEAGEELVADLQSVQVYASQRMAHLATCVGQPGFAEAVRAERDSIALKACVKAADRADNIDGRVLGFIEGALTIASRALVIAV